MPTYEYECDGCRHTFEEFQSITAEPLKKCPKCSKKKLRRLFGIGAALLFKGSGFYETDYRSESYKAAAKSDQESPKASGEGKNGTNGTADTPKDSAPASGAKSKAKSPKSKD